MEREVSEFLTFTATLFETAVSGDPPQPAKGARSSGPWYRRAPGTKRFMPLLREFAASGGLVSFNTGNASILAGKIAPPLVPTPDKLQIDTRFWLFGSEEQKHIFEVPYPSEQIRDLCCGKWTRFGPGGVCMAPKSLLPSFRIDGDNTVIEWPTAPQAEVQVWQDHTGPIRRLLGQMIKRVTHTSIDRVVIRPDYIDVQAGGLMMNNAIPRIVPE